MSIVPNRYRCAGNRKKLDACGELRLALVWVEGEFSR
jgi:hypothetical protein